MYVLRSIVKAIAPFSRLLTFIMMIVFLYYIIRRITDYAKADERQVQNLRKALCLGFIIMIVFCALFTVLNAVYNHILFTVDAQFLFVIIAGICSALIYSIFSDALITEYMTYKRLHIMSLILLSSSILGFVCSLLYIRVETDLIISISVILQTSSAKSLIALLFHLIVFLSLLIKRIINRFEKES